MCLRAQGRRRDEFFGRSVLAATFSIAPTHGAVGGICLVSLSVTRAAYGISGRAKRHNALPSSRKSGPTACALRSPVRPLLHYILEFLRRRRVLLGGIFDRVARGPNWSRVATSPARKAALRLARGKTA